jgi:hypothetical protein
MFEHYLSPREEGRTQANAWNSIRETITLRGPKFRCIRKAENKRREGECDCGDICGKFGEFTINIGISDQRSTGN